MGRPPARRTIASASFNEREPASRVTGTLTTTGRLILEEVLYVVAIISLDCVDSVVESLI